jgi:drug/metabolite transporter (DMT)-like permease
MTSRAAATLGGILAILIWSTSVALGRSLARQMGPLTAAAVVYTFGGLLALAWQVARRPQGLSLMLRLPAAYLVGCGGLFIFYTAAFFLALGLADDHRQSIALGLVNYLWPALTILLSVPILKARARWLLVPGTLLALTGVALVLSHGQSLPLDAIPKALAQNPVALGFALAAAMAWALYSNLARLWGAAEGTGAVPLFVLASGLVLLTIRCLRPEPGSFHPRVLCEAGLMGLTVPISYACWDRAMRQGDMRLVTACSYLTPLLSTLFAAAYLRVSPTPGMWLGCAALVAGSLASWWAVDHPVRPPVSQNSA